MVAWKKCLGFIKTQQRLLGFFGVSRFLGDSLVSDNVRRLLLRKVHGWYRVSDVLYKGRSFSSIIHSQGLSWEASSHVVLSRKLESALKNHQVDEAWQVFKDFRSLYGFPDRSVLNRFVTELSYSSDPLWLQKACDLVRSGLKENSGLVESDVLIKLGLSLARANMPEPASKILRLMLERGNIPPMDVLRMAVMHMVKTEIGTCLVANYLVQVCDRFRRLNEEKNSLANVMKPDTLMFNLVLHACVRYGFSLKGQELIELMAKIGVVADAHSIVIISFIHEMNGLRDELGKFKEHIDKVLGPRICHYQHFYDNLLSLHFKFDDIDAAGQLVVDICRDRESLSIQKLRMDLAKPRGLPVGSHHIRSGVKLKIMPELLQKDSLLGIESKPELVNFRDGKLLPTNKAIAKFVCGYKKHGKISELSKVLLFSGGSSLCANVINACVNQGWLETAHDILDDMESLCSPMGLFTYNRLLAGYYNQKMVRNAEALLRQMKNVGLLKNLSDKDVVSEAEDKTTVFNYLADCLVREMDKEKQSPFTLYEMNSSVYYFCKAKMRGDALKTFRRMQEMKLRPTVQTFSFMIDLYSSLQMYREITILWGEIKRNIEGGSLKPRRDLFELLLLNFIRGGYFERVLEVIGYMNKNRMYTDLMMYRSEFLRLHKDLYRSLRASVARNEAQMKRVEHVCAFRKLVGID